MNKIFYKLILDKRLKLIDLSSSRPITIPHNRILLEILSDDYKPFNRYDILYIAKNIYKENLISDFICKCGNFKHQKLNYCSRKCNYFKQAVVKKMEETCLKTKGVRNAAMLPDHKDKIHKTSQLKWGKNSYTQTDECKNKIIHTNLKKYGTKVSSQSDIVKQKAKYHFLAKYGKNSYVETDEFINKRNEKMLNTYGKIHALQIDKCKKKAEKTCFKNYGVNCYLQSKAINDMRNSPDIQRKRHETMKRNNSYGDKSAPEDNIYKILKDKFPSVTRKYRSDKYPFPCDFYIPEIDIYIEIHFCQFHHNHPFNSSNLLDMREVFILQLKSLLLRKRRGNNLKNQYDSIINVWTNKDVRKLKIAKDNNLNWFCFYNYEQFWEWFNNYK